MDRRGFIGGAIAGAAAFAGVQNEQTKSEIKNASWAVVEMMGYKQLAGRLSQGVAGLLQLDIPAPGGMITQMINPQSIYRVTFIDEPTACALAKRIDPLPAVELQVPPRQHALGFDHPDDDDNRDDYEY